MVGRCLRELVDSGLVHDGPVGYADLLAFERPGIVNGFDHYHGVARDTQMLLLPQVFGADIFC